MDEARVRAYRVLLAQGLLHLKWDLARFYGGLSLTQPWQLFTESQAVRTAAFRAFAFHNLAIFAASDFAGFSEDWFWAEIDKFRRDCPDALGRFLKSAVADGIAAAVRAVADCQRSDRTWQRVWRRFGLGQSRIRTALLARHPPPDTPPHGPARRPVAAQVLAHLHAAFPDADCPIAAFQHATRTFFV